MEVEVEFTRFSFMLKGIGRRKLEVGSAPEDKYVRQPSLFCIRLSKSGRISMVVKSKMQLIDLLDE